MQKLIPMNKKGMGGVAITLIALVIIVAIAGSVWLVSQSVTKQKVAVTGCEVEPYVDNSTFNQYLKGTGVAVTYSYVIEGDETQARTLTPGTSGTAFAVGDKLKILSSAGSYIDRVDDFTITKCGANKFINYIYGADGGTVDILSQNLVAVTDGVTAGNAVNLSDGGSANPLNAILRLDGVVDESTGQLLITVETNDTEVDTVTISAKSAGAKVINTDYPTGNLNLFSAEGTAPSMKTAFVVDELLDGAQADYNIKFTPESGITMGAGDATGFVYVNVYAGQWFTDDDGSFQFGWEDSDGSVKYETAMADHDALVS